MQNRTTLKRHAKLVDDMAGKMGLDLEELTMRGALAIGELEDAVLRCTGCASPDACEHWLATQGETADAPPGYCRNSDLFRDLRNA